MKMFFIFCVFLILLYAAGCLGAFLKKEQPYQPGDRGHTKALKGFAILLVIWAHCGADMGVGGIQFVAGAGVAVFLVCSGYGLMCSYQKSGLSFFWRKRLLRVIVPCWIVNFLLQVYERDFSAKRFLASMILKGSNWFVFYIIICYVIFWCICLFCDRRKLTERKLTGMITIAFMIWFVIESCYFPNKGMPFLEARQMLSFPLGVGIAVWKEEIIEKWNTVKKRKHGTAFIVTAAFALTGAGCAGQILAQADYIEALPYVLSNILYLIVDLLLVCAVLIISVIWKYLFINLFLQKAGEAAYELFLLHLPFIYRIEDMESMVFNGVLLTVFASGLCFIDRKIFSYIEKR